MDEPSAYMTAAEVAAHIRQSVGTVHRKRKAGVLPACGGNGKGWLWRRADVEAYVARGGAGPPPESEGPMIVRAQVEALLARRRQVASQN